MNSILTRKAYPKWMQKVAMLFILAIAALLFAGHGTHLLAYSGYMLFFACILMHLFMHGGHDGHGHHSRSEDGQRVHNDEVIGKFDVDRADRHQGTGQYKQGLEDKQ